MPLVAEICLLLLLNELSPLQEFFLKMPIVWACFVVACLNVMPNFAVTSAVICETNAETLTVIISVVK